LAGGLAVFLAATASGFAQAAISAAAMPAGDMPTIATTTGPRTPSYAWSLNYEYYKAEQDWNVFRQAEILYPAEIWETSRKRDAIDRGVGCSWGPERSRGMTLLAASLDLGFRWADDRTNSRAQDRTAGTRTAPGTANPGFGAIAVWVDTSDREYYARL